MRGIVGLLLIASMVIAGISAGSEAQMMPPLESLNILINEKYSKWTKEVAPQSNGLPEDIFISQLNDVQIFSGNRENSRKAKVERIASKESYAGEYYGRTNYIGSIDHRYESSLIEDFTSTSQLLVDPDTLSTANSALHFKYSPISHDSQNLYGDAFNENYASNRVEGELPSEKNWEDLLSFSSLESYEALSALENYLDNSNSRRSLKKSENVNLSYYPIDQDISNLKSISDTNIDENVPLIDQIANYPNSISNDNLDLLSLQGKSQKTYNIGKYEAEFPYSKLETDLNLKKIYDSSIYSYQNDIFEHNNIADLISNLNQLQAKNKAEFEGVDGYFKSPEENFQALLSENVQSPEKMTIDPKDSLFGTPAIPHNIPSFRSRDSSRLEKLALIIGINKYDSRFGLHTCVNDANEISDLLESLGYKTIKITDNTMDKPTRENIINKGLAYIKDNNYIGDFIIYYSGHGELDDDGNFYLVPKNANKSISSCIGSEDIDKYTKNLDNLAIIIDACNSGAFSIKNRSGLLIMASSSENEPSNEVWFGKMSIFTQNLIQAIDGEIKFKNNHITLQECFDDAQKSTMEWSNKYYLKQNPKMKDLTNDKKYYLN